MESKKLKENIDSIFNDYCKYLKENGIVVVMPTFYPERGSIIQELAKNGVECCILGGKEGQKIFENVEQYGIEEDTTGMAETEGQRIKIVSKLPKKFRNRKLLIHCYVPYEWDKYIQEQFSDVEIVSKTAQNSYKFFEEKINLQSILKTAGLQEHIIPSEIFKVNDTITNGNCEDVYNRLKNEDGKIVIQKCGEGNLEAGGGKSTYIINSLDEFKKAIQEIKTGFIKVVKFINGAESNLSFFCGNTEINTNGKIKRVELDGYFYEQDKALRHYLEARVVKEEKVFVISGKATLKCVGDDRLTYSSGNGVGNSVGYIFSEDLQEKILNISQKVGSVMARCGKIGLAGCDLIIDKKNHIWINEINDRQQGPTEQMSSDAEKNNIPSLIKLAFIMSHCDFKEQEEFLKGIKEQAENVSNSYLQNGGSFYIKFNSTHTDENLGITFKYSETLQKGYYKITKDTEGKWTINTTPLDSISEIPPVDLTENEIILFFDGSIIQDTTIEPKKQIFRIVGESKTLNDSPFIIKDGKTILNPEWEPIVSCIYNKLVKISEIGADAKVLDSYQDFNPFLQQRLVGYWEKLVQRQQEEREKNSVLSGK